MLRMDSSVTSPASPLTIGVLIKKADLPEQKGLYGMSTLDLASLESL